jgi:hypothetical protein
MKPDIDKMNLMVDPVEMFPSVEKMIYCQAWKFAKKYPITFEEAKSQAYYGFIRACYKYTPGKQKFSSWCYFLVWVTLKDLIMARAKDPMIPVDPMPDTEAGRREAEELMGVSTDESGMFREGIEDTVSDLSNEAKEMLGLLLEPPAELLLRTRPTPKQLVCRVKKHLISQGRTKDQLQNAYCELGNRLKVALAT